MRGALSVSESLELIPRPASRAVLPAGLEAVYFSERPNVMFHPRTSILLPPRSLFAVKADSSGYPRSDRTDPLADNGAFQGFGIVRFEPCADGYQATQVNGAQAVRC